jgi:hypothetical protein
VPWPCSPATTATHSPAISSAWSVWQPSAVQCSAVQCSAVQCSAVQRSAVHLQRRCPFRAMV